ncbi:Taxilin family [Trypanosoma melophagium]|uniref:Taxilin family n=1 Tax=Trypanosoma melophagium TaxID=715481 RepID=UPI00351A6923|nr:Taxilin family [Trypanosoma melophagium]
MEIDQPCNNSNEVAAVPTDDIRSSEDAPPTSKSTKEDSAVEALRQIQENQKIEAETRAMVKALLAEKGESHVQNMLQSEIQIVKKKESELAATKKKVANVVKDIDELQLEIRRTIEAKSEAERVCKVLQEAMKRRAALTEQAVKEMEEHRRGVEEKVDNNVNDIRSKCDERKKEAEAIMEENERLREEVAKQKKHFDDSYASYQQSWKDREVHVEELMRSFREISKETELLEARLALVRRERQVAQEGSVVLQQQLDMYNTRFREFGETHSVGDVEKIAAQQRSEGEARIAQLESEKKEANELRLKFDKETAKLRAALAAAKREWAKTEKAKLAAERQCRLAQERARQKEKGVSG